MRIPYFAVFFCPVRQNPLQIAMFLSLAQHTAIYTVLNLLSKSTASCDVFNNMVAKNTAKTSQTAPKSQNLASRLPTRHMGKICVSKPKIGDHKSKTHVFFFTFLLPVPGGRVHELVHSVLYKNSVFLKSAVATYQKHGFPGKPVPYSCLCHPDDHALSTFGAGGFLG